MTTKPPESRCCPICNAPLVRKPREQRIFFTKRITCGNGTCERRYKAGRNALEFITDERPPRPDLLIQCNDLRHDALKPSEIIETTCEVMGITTGELWNIGCRSEHLVKAKEAICGLLYTWICISTPEIAKLAGFKGHHTGVAAAILRFDGWPLEEVADLQCEVRTRIYRKRRAIADTTETWFNQLEEVKQDYWKNRTKRIRAKMMRTKERVA